MDWNQDGKLDILSGCYWTEDADAAQIQILTGKGDNDFEESVSLENMAGKPLENIADIEDDSPDTRVICTHQHAADYDNDGDLDLIVGCFGEQFFLYENKAKKDGAPALVESPVMLSVESNAYHSAPHLVDWDDDGDLDLLTGTSDGGALISENTGTPEKPDWQSFKQLVDPSTAYQQDPDKEIVMGRSTRVWATDWNGDGQLDLLVGDNSSLKGKSDKDSRSTGFVWLLIRKPSTQAVSTDVAK